MKKIVSNKNRRIVRTAGRRRRICSLRVRVASNVDVDVDVDVDVGDNE
jgi:hypothetical protein